MFEQRNQKILLGVALALLALLVLDQSLVSPVWDYFAGLDARIGELSADIEEAEQLRSGAERDHLRSEQLQRRLRAATEEGQNEFRRYLESLLTPHVEVVGSAQVSAADLPQAPGLKRILYDLQMVGPLDAVRRALGNLDASTDLLRIERLELANRSLEDPALGVSMLISTVASATPEPGSSQRPFLLPSGQEPPQLAKNIFFPAGRLSSPGPVGDVTQHMPTGEFLLAGTVHSAQRRAALLEFPASGRLRWVGVGERVGTMTVADVTPEGAVFELGGQRLSLAVGRPGAELLAGRRVLGGGFELVGVCHGQDQRFAMVQPKDGGAIQRVHVRDRLGRGIIVEIAEDAVVLEIAGARERVPVGGSLAGRIDLR